MVLIPHLRPRALALGLVEVAPAGQSWVLIPRLRPRALALGLVEVAPASQSWVLTPRLRPILGLGLRRRPLWLDFVAAFGDSVLQSRATPDGLAFALNRPHWRIVVRKQIHIVSLRKIG